MVKLETLSQLFSYLNDISFPYVVLRNWDELPYDVVLGEHSDLDLLVYDRSHFFEVIDCAKEEYPYPRVRVKIPIGNSFIYADIRHIGDDYYPIDFERAILDTRELNERGFFTPNPIHHRIALAYHAVHHKNYISKEYVPWLGDATIPDLLKALQESEIGWVPPKDTTVGTYNGYWKGATSIVEKKDGWVLKTQTNYKDYDLLNNEAVILARATSKHFPNVRAMRGGTLEIEDCGEALSHLNAPSDWKKQLTQILKDLKSHKIVHRDIKLDNLLVKNGTIKLIDFGWARYEHIPDLKEPPTCLGFPNKPSYGFDDQYSMNRVVKQLDYQFEEAGVLV